MCVVFVSVYTSPPPSYLGGDGKSCEVRQVIVLDIMRAKLLGHTGSLVFRQAARNLTTVRFSQWRKVAALGEVAEKHTKFIDN
jgi:hypothetical protein